MRSLGDLPARDLGFEGKISVMNWNQKFLLKFELGALEQTYKIPELEVATLEELRSRVTREFVARVRARFDEMDRDLSSL